MRFVFGDSIRGMVAAFSLLLLVLIAGCLQSTAPPPAGRSSANIIVQDFSTPDHNYLIFNTDKLSFVDSFNLGAYKGFGLLSAEKDRMFVRTLDSILLIDILTKQLVGGMFAPEVWPNVSPLAISFRGDAVAVIVPDSGLMVFDPRDFSTRFTLPDTAFDFRSYSFSIDGSRLFVIGDDRRLHVLRIAEAVSVETEMFMATAGHPADIAGLSDGSLAAVITRILGPVYLELYDLNTGDLVYQERVHPTGFGNIAFSSDEQRLFIEDPGSLDTAFVYPGIPSGGFSVHVFDLPSRSFVGRILTDTGYATSFLPTADDRYIVGRSGFFTDRLSIIDLQTLQLDTVIVFPDRSLTNLWRFAGEL